MRALKKQLEDGTWVEKVDHLAQSPQENLADMIAGFFSYEDLNKKQFDKILEDVLVIADNYFALFSIAKTIAPLENYRSLLKDLLERCEGMISELYELEFLEDIVEDIFKDAEWLEHLRQRQKNFKYPEPNLLRFTDYFEFEIDLTRKLPIMN